MEKDYPHNGGGQRLNRIECRAVACGKHSESLVPQDIGDARAENAEI